MGYLELLQDRPGLFVLLLLISLVLTLFVYGAFPLIFAKKRKTPITKKKYKFLCFGINFIGMVFFIALNGAASGAPYVLWTLIFSNRGVKTLTDKGLLAETHTVQEAHAEVPTETPIPEAPETPATASVFEEPTPNVEKVSKEKKPTRKIRIYLEKACNFLLTHKKALLIVAAACIVVFVTSLIGYGILDAQMSKLASHYNETVERISMFPSEYLYGCGLRSCQYCKGSKILTYEKGLYSIEKYSSISDMRTYFELFAGVFGFFTVVCLALVTVVFIYRRKINTTDK